MTRTYLNPKVSSIGTQTGASETPSRVDNDNGRPQDSYVNEAANPYRNLVSGQTKAVSIPPPDNTTPIGDLMSVVRNERARGRQDPMQAFIGTLMMGDDGAGPSPSDFELPAVPLLQRDILNRNTAGIGMKPIVERYVALERVIQNLISNAQSAINSATTTHMDPREIESLREYEGKLMERLILCRDELAKARRAYNREQTEGRRPVKLFNGGNVHRFKQPCTRPDKVLSGANVHTIKENEPRPDKVLPNLARRRSS